MLCPKDFNPCMDDLCYGGGCIADGCVGLSMYRKCDGCGALISDDDIDECTCDDADDFYDNDPESRPSAGE